MIIMCVYVCVFVYVSVFFQSLHFEEKKKEVDLGPFKYVRPTRYLNYSNKYRKHISPGKVTEMRLISRTNGSIPKTSSYRIHKERRCMKFVPESKQ